MFKILVFYIILIHQLTKLKVLVYKTAFYLAVENNNEEIVKLFLTHEELDINIPYILPNKFSNTIPKKIQFLNNI